MNKQDKANRTILLTVAYDGTDYAGWQIQKEKSTVQLSLEKSLYEILQENIKTTCAGRTDSGVHALGNRVHFKTISKIKTGNLLKALNSLLPRDIRVIRVEDKPDTFHARYEAVRRWYRYYIYNSRISMPFLDRYSFFYPYPIDIGHVKRSLKFLVGEHDFTSFCSKKDENKVKIRKIFYISLKKTGKLYYFDIVGSGFLHNMIRIIVGTALAINKNKEKPDKMKEILFAKNRMESGMTVPPNGLFLMKVTYKEELTWLDKIMPARGCHPFLFSHLS